MNLVEKSYQIRQDVLDLVYNGKAGHIGGDYSVCDILVTLYYHVMNMSPEKVNDPGYFPKEDLKTYSQFGSKYIGHPNNKINGIEMNSGSLGHGLPVAVGMALAGKMDQAPYRVYTVMGDGELAEGSVWEGVMAASHYKLDNLTAVVDRNRLQISGSTEVVMHHEDLGKRFESFGWHVVHAPGNDISALIEAFEEAKATKGMPTMIIADTVKGCGVSFMENQAVWHHKVPTEAEYIQAKN